MDVIVFVIVLFIIEIKFCALHLLSVQNVRKGIGL